MTHAAFAAMGDPTRRVLLERLRLDGPLSLNRLAQGLPMTRQAVTRHIDVLRDAGLIRMRRRGRERIHELDAAPMREIADFLAPYAAAWDERLERLAAHLEENHDRCDRFHLRHRSRARAGGFARSSLAGHQ